MKNELLKNLFTKFVTKLDTMKIRRAVLEDAAILSKLGAATFYETFTGTCTSNDMDEFLVEYYNIEQVKKELKDPNDFFYFLEIENDVVGYIRTKEGAVVFDTKHQDKALELKRLYVLKPFHGKGVAQALMNFVMDFAQKNEFKIVWLGVWEYNFRARKFYEKMGFNNTGFKHDFPIGSTPQTDLWYWQFLNHQKKA